MDQLVRSTLEDTPEKTFQPGELPIPELLENVTMKCLHKDPAERVQSMEN